MTRVIVTKKSICKDIQGQKALIGVIRDITEQKRKADEERRQLKELEIFYEASLGREERILELKNEVQRLEEELRNRS